MKNKFNKIALGILCGIAILFILTAIVMLLWNALLPQILHVTAINFWQAMGILVLSKILFGGFHGGRKKWGSKQHLKEKFDQMSEEDRQRFKEKLKERFGNHPFCRK